MLTFAHSLLTPHRTRLGPPHAVLSEILQFESDDSITRNHECHEIPGQATADDQLKAAVVFHQSVSTIPGCCVRLVFPLTQPREQSTKQCHDAALKGNPSKNVNERQQITSTTDRLLTEIRIGFSVPLADRPYFGF